jgi:hypothetical protein
MARPVIGSLAPAVTAYAEATGALKRSLAETREPWNDVARHAFDRQYADPLGSAARHTEAELRRLAEELLAAASLLASSAYHEGKH